VAATAGEVVAVVLTLHLEAAAVKVDEAVWAVARWRYRHGQDCRARLVANLEQAVRYRSELLSACAVVARQFTLAELDAPDQAALDEAAEPDEPDGPDAVAALPDLEDVDAA
jgi:hypothetical protein